MNDVEINLEKTVNEMLPEGYKLEDLKEKDRGEICFWFKRMLYAVDTCQSLNDSTYNEIPSFQQIYDDIVENFIADFYLYVLSDMKDFIISTIDNYDLEEGE